MEITSCRLNALLWAFKSPLPYSYRCPTLFQPMHAVIDVIGSIQGLRQRVEHTHPPMVLRSRRCQFSGRSSCRNSHGKRQTQRHGLCDLLMTDHQAVLVKHHHIGVKDPVPFGRAIQFSNSMPTRASAFAGWAAMRRQAFAMFV